LTREVAKDVFLIDTEIFGVPGFTSAYLLAEEKPTLIETAAATCAPTILKSLRGLGFDPKDIAYIAVTHIHLDHAGGVGALAVEMPKAEVLVHKRGARHLVDPSRLMSAVTQMWREEEVSRYGAMIPVESDRVRAVRDGEVIELGASQSLQVIDTPGHSMHHLCLRESKNKGLFTGDAVGIFFPEKELLFPATPPPEFDLDLAVETVTKLMDQDIELLYFSHFGVTSRARETLQKAKDMLQHWGELTRMASEEGGFELAIDRLRGELEPMLAQLENQRGLREYQERMILPMSAAGYMSYFERKKWGY
jgi:glyoxylase-like metal-dependent hydrolase (beta-lactamase superfamily II)